MESIALDTAACQKCLESASSFGSMTTCFSKLAYSTANFAIANAEKQNLLSGNIKISRKLRHLSNFCNYRGCASVWPGRFDGHVWRVCAKHGGVPQNCGREKLEK